ncbi:hypothetical protein CLOLEP_02593 [[Clostridium] leptum DSM 753]|uniref:Uncharacterized protein n=1 Tax=[Clostridium] leptum DSM 753 TaxID=428125 RepID=A7VVI0_9FIRM|nr:hypothetical protein CLOLEP_02593 [[Clostridium] leptum DSM 753]
MFEIRFSFRPTNGATARKAALLSTFQILFMTKTILPALTPLTGVFSE